MGQKVIIIGFGSSLGQRSPNTGMQAAVFVQPANAFCMPYIKQRHKCIVLATQPL